MPCVCNIMYTIENRLTTSALKDKAMDIGYDSQTTQTAVHSKVS